MEPVYTYLRGNRRTEAYDDGAVRVYVDDVLVSDEVCGTLEAANERALVLVES